MEHRTDSKAKAVALLIAGGSLVNVRKTQSRPTVIHYTVDVASVTLRRVERKFDAALAEVEAAEGKALVDRFRAKRRGK